MLKTNTVSRIEDNSNKTSLYRSIETCLETQYFLSYLNNLRRPDPKTNVNI